MIHSIPALAAPLLFLLLGSHSAGAIPGQDAGPSTSVLPRVETASAPHGIVALPRSLPAVLRETFVKYTKLAAPSGRDIHLFAQGGVSDRQLIRAREVMRFYLTAAPDTSLGANKVRVANAMAERQATLVLFDDERSAERAFDGDLGEMDLFFQDLYASEAVVEGSPEYLDNSVRDATLEEVFHLVHGAGIRPAIPAVHALIEDATAGAIRSKLWFTNEEWEAEGSSPFEYIISVIDVLYGFWAHDPDRNGVSFGGEYVVCTPAALRDRDAAGLAAVRSFLPAHFDFDATLDPRFDGNFFMVPRAGLAYTLKSSHLTHVRLSGSRNSGIVGNARDNRLEGNAGNNHIRGGDGQDRVTFQGTRSEYAIEETAPGRYVIADTFANRDGTDTLESIEELLFLERSGPRAELRDVTQELDRNEGELRAFQREQARFDIDGRHAHMHGTIGPSTPGRVIEVLLMHPEVDTIVMHDVPRSVDDEANLRAARWVHLHGLAIHLTAESEIASGGTDFFLAGKRRTMEPGARIGVHSWAGSGASGSTESGADPPREHDEHAKYLEFYGSVGIDSEFYWFTLQAASPEGIHWMTPAEIARFGLKAE